MFIFQEKVNFHQGSKEQTNSLPRPRSKFVFQNFKDGEAHENQTRENLIQPIYFVLSYLSLLYVLNLQVR
jgi:hypothetical protein